jgi:hypothetical protein
MTGGGTNRSFGKSHFRSFFGYSRASNIRTGVGPPAVAYSYLKAIMGSTLVARRAGI